MGTDRGSFWVRSLLHLPRSWSPNWLHVWISESAIDSIETINQLRLHGFRRLKTSYQLWIRTDSWTTRYHQKSSFKVDEFEIDHYRRDDLFMTIDQTWRKQVDSLTSLVLSWNTARKMSAAFVIILQMCVCVCERWTGWFCLDITLEGELCDVELTLFVQSGVQILNKQDMTAGVQHDDDFEQCRSSRQLKSELPANFPESVTIKEKASAIEKQTAKDRRKEDSSFWLI